MEETFRRGHCRWLLPLTVLVLLVCISVAGAADCPAGCSCLMPADAKLKGLSYCNGQQSICGYDNTRSAMYCYGSGTVLFTPKITLVPVTPVTVTTTAPAACPAGCECLTDPAATAKYGSYTRCSEGVCGYEQVLTHVADPVPKYCVKPQSTGTCPAGCECMFESAAKDKFGSYERCSATSCYSVVTGSATVNAYCFRQVTVSPVACPSGCDCISDATAKAKGGKWARCSADICGYEQSTATLAAVVKVPRYCMKQQSAACPEGCSCILEEDAKEKGLKKCDPGEAPCAYQPVSVTSNTAGTGKPLYCYMTGVTTTVTPSVCPENCGCMSEAIAKEKFGGVYKRCTDKVCGYEASATTANGVPQYCFGSGTTVTPSVCPENCGCMSEAIAKEKFGGVYKRCTDKICGYEASATTANGVPQYCFGSGVTTTSTLPPAGTCAYDAAKNACTGSCKTGSPCTAVSKGTDAAGKVTVVCGCMDSGCSFDYDKGACTGTCKSSGEACQLNTLVRDVTGRIITAECHCKGSGETPTVTPSTPCTCDPKLGSCTGSCPDGQGCQVTGTTTDAAGKKVCSSCACQATCTLNADNMCSGTCATGAPCTATVFKDDSGAEKVSCGCGGSGTGAAPQPTQQPDVARSIGNFFKSLFGWK